MRETDLAYLAGIIDGEGTISASIGKTSNGLNKYLCVFNTNFALISWIMSRFGGTLHSRTRSDKWKTEHQIKWSPKDACIILELVLPYLVIKKEQAEILLILHKEPLTNTERQILVTRIQELNRRGPRETEDKDSGEV